VSLTVNGYIVNKVPLNSPFAPIIKSEPVKQNDENRTIALAATLQACGLVRKLAYKNEVDDTEIRTLLESLFMNEAPTIKHIYGNLSALKPGFTLLTALLRSPGQSKETMEISRYLIALMQLEGRLNKNTETGDKLIKGLEDIKRQRDYFDDALNTAIVTHLDELYQETISKLGPKIIVKGEQDQLNNSEVAARIRALLLSGIRSAVLWRQAGGGRFKLMFRRRQMIEQAEEFLIF